MNIQKTIRAQIRICVVFSLAILLGACITGYREQKEPVVERLAADEVYDLTGEWNDTDSQQVANKMIDSALEGGWLKRWEGSQLPVVIVGNVSDNTGEDIDVRLFIKDLEAELVNSGEVAFVASRFERSQIRDEREDQQFNASEETMKRIAQEAGADLILIGSIDSNTEENADTKIVSYLVSLELVNLETNIKAWIATERIKKRIDKVSKANEEVRAQHARERVEEEKKRLNRSSDW